MSTALRWIVSVGLAFLLPAVAHADGTAGDEAAKKLARAAMDKSYNAGDFDVALRKLGQGVTLCRSKGCSPHVNAQLLGSMAIVHWVGTEDQAAATEDLRAMVKADPTFQLEDTNAPPELVDALDAVRAEAKRGAKAGVAAPSPAVATKPPAEAAKASKDEKEAAKAEADKVAEEKKIAAQKAADEKKAAEDKKADDAKKAAEEKKAAEDKREEARKAAEEAKKAAEEKKEAARKAIEDAKKEAEEKKEAARKAAEEKKEAARKAAEEKKEAARKAAEEKKEAARVAAEERKAEAARKAEEAAKKAEEERLAKIEERLRKPPPVGKLQETPWHDQTKGYPIPVFVKVPTPPRSVEKPRGEVVKVVTEYATPSMSAPQQLELKALPGGGFGGFLPCDVSDHEGEVTYFTRALNKYENPVDVGGTRAKPNKVVVKPVFTGSFPHLPGQLPPRTCEEEEETAKQAAAKAKEANEKQTGDACQGDGGCPDGGCAKEGCKAAAPAPAVPSEKPRGGGCAGCQVGASPTGTLGTVLAATAFCAWLSRRRRRASAPHA